MHTHTQNIYIYIYIYTLAQLVWAVEYTGSISAEGQDSSNESPAYDTKWSDREVPGMQSTALLSCT